jgi:hypothetical protein
MAIIGAFITGSLGIAIISSSQAAQGAMSTN